MESIIDYEQIKYVDDFNTIYYNILLAQEKRNYDLTFKEIDYKIENAANELIENYNSMGGGSTVSASKPESGTVQIPTWEQLNAKILQAIKRDEQPEVFQALLADLSNLMTEIKRTGQLYALSIKLQEDGSVFLSRRNNLSDSESKKALQKINNILKKQ